MPKTKEVTKLIGKDVLIEYLIQYHKMTKSEAKVVVDNLFQSLMDVLVNEGEFKLPCGFGKLRVKEVPARTVMVFGEKKDLPARVKVTFRAGKALKNLLEQSPNYK